MSDQHRIELFDNCLLQQNSDENNKNYNIPLVFQSEGAGIFEGTNIAGGEATNELKLRLPVASRSGSEIFTGNRFNYEINRQRNSKAISGDATGESKKIVLSENLVKAQKFYQLLKCLPLDCQIMYFLFLNHFEKVLSAKTLKSDNTTGIKNTCLRLPDSSISQDFFVLFHYGLTAPTFDTNFLPLLCPTSIVVHSGITGRNSNGLVNERVSLPAGVLSHLDQFLFGECLELSLGKCCPDAGSLKSSGQVSSVLTPNEIPSFPVLSVIVSDMASVLLPFFHVSDNSSHNQCLFDPTVLVRTIGSILRHTIGRKACEFSNCVGSILSAVLSNFFNCNIQEKVTVFKDFITQNSFARAICNILVFFAVNSPSNLFEYYFNDNEILQDESDVGSAELLEEFKRLHSVSVYVLKLSLNIALLSTHVVNHHYLPEDKVQCKAEVTDTLCNSTSENVRVSACKRLQSIEGLSVAYRVAKIELKELERMALTGVGLKADETRGKKSGSETFSGSFQDDTLSCGIQKKKTSDLSFEIQPMHLKYAQDSIY